MDCAGGSTLEEPPKSPRSPPACVDLYGKRRQTVKVQVLEREIGLLQEELKAVEDLELASRCCKEVDDFVRAKVDPLITINQETHKSKPFWKRIWGKFYSNLLWICCCCGCLHHLRTQTCCGTCSVSCCSPCPCPSCCFCSSKVMCQGCCNFIGLSCLQNACCCFKSSSYKCKKVNLCSNFAKSCHSTCCL
ncbi:guanine nucleotide-binding protein subunit gamma 3-like [Mangifera indica]|uniref:guanine nucleotide-binding protein subunit gamma 3-like n=1 Tax=Mangifera indica TaxID=29780 RepID=UPI001CFA5602|nr:guanine nucleotide-binding protein subunit gamma 3-like [Mangifera indica]